MAEAILAPLSGNIWKVAVEVGDTVEEDDEVIIIEALKMETPVYAPVDGVITKVHVEEGEVVEEDQVLISIA